MFVHGDLLPRLWRGCALEGHTGNVTIHEGAALAGLEVAAGHRQREPPDELTFNLPLLRVGFPDVEDFLRAHEEFFEAHESLESFVPASPIPLPLAQLRQAY